MIITNAVTQRIVFSIPTMCLCVKSSPAAGQLTELKTRNSTFDLLLRASGSKKTFKEGISDMLDRAQRDSVFPTDQKKPAFKTEFDDVDFQNLSQAWNGRH